MNLPSNTKLENSDKNFWFEIPLIIDEKVTLGVRIWVQKKDDEKHVVRFYVNNGKSNTPYELYSDAVEAYLKFL